MFHKIAAIFVAAILTAPAVAAPFADPASGLAVDPPMQFSAEQIEVGGYDLSVGMLSSDGQPPAEDTEGYQCIIGFMRAPYPSSLSQVAINLAMTSQERQKLLAASMAAGFTLESQQVFLVSGVAGTEFVMRHEGPVEKSPHAYLAIMESAPGRTVLSCSAVPGAIEAALPVYRAIRDGIIAPTR